MEYDKNLNILYLSPQNVIPPRDGGKIGIYYPVKELAKLGNIYYAFIGELNEELKKEYHNINVEPISFNIDIKDKFIFLIKNFFDEIPFKMKKYYNNNFFKQLLQIVKEKDINIVYVSHPHMAEYALKIKNKNPTIKIILREHNIEYELVKEYYKHCKNLLKKIIAYWQYKKTKRYEIELWKKFDYILFISDSDVNEASRYININRDKYKVIYDGFNVMNNVFDKIDKIKKEKNSFIFTGSVKTVQNQINLKKFINEVWKPFIKTHSYYKLFLTGSDDKLLEDKLNISIDELSSLNIINLGFVDDIEKIIMSKEFFISPTYIGSGIRIKVLHALAMGMPVFVTEKDFKMVRYFKDLENILSFVNFEEFERKVIILEKNEFLKKEISKKAINLIKEHLSWDVYREQIQKLLKELSEKK